jgi:CBS domain-containing membrane protein
MTNHILKSILKRYAFYLGGDQPPVSNMERIRSSIGAMLGLGAVIFLAKGLGELVGAQEWLMASLGASALLVFVLPGSPMAQPWAVVAGNTLSAVVGIAVIGLVQEPLMAIPSAACLAIMGMLIFRCLHPPAAAVALIAVMGHVTNLSYIVFPVMVDSCLLVITGAIYNNLTGKKYPNRPSKFDH